jgi:hypothetical protein
MECASKDFVKVVSPTLPVFRRARIAVIFGNVNTAIVTNMAQHTASLYRKGSVCKIIVTGGKTYADRNHTEAELARMILLSRGVSGRHILLDNHSMNSYENVVNARRLLKRSEGELKREPVQFFGMEYAARRFLMTIAQNWPEAIPSFRGFNSFHVPKENWHLCHEIHALLAQDKEKWDIYRNKGHIKDVDVRRLQRVIHAHNSRQRRVKGSKAQSYTP